MLHEGLYVAYEAAYLVQFRWIKAALNVPYVMKPDGAWQTSPHVSIGPTLREAIFTREKGRCYLCGLLVRATLREGPRACTIDHIVPLSHHGPPKGMSNLALAHQQCNQLKGGSPHPRTVYELDDWQCQRCQESVSRGPEQSDWQWNRPIVEHLVPLDSPDIWRPGRCWTCHLCCHAYHLPIPPQMLVYMPL
ncbi:MAG: HNH endonuclease [Ktedonobacterales bacterium]|nr:HNH endonuclease [Ktedonobacterales bacterium]